MDIKQVFSFLKKDLDKVEKAFAGYISSEVPLATKISSYVLLSGGKRVRPSILILSAKMCGGSVESLTPVACAIELLHTATLLHDDVIDQAKLRRGQKAANVVWSNKASVLTGDFMNAKVIQILINTRNFEVLDLFSEAIINLAAGEIFQMGKEKDTNITQDDYFYIIKNKTAGLMAAGALTGGILAGKSSAEKEALRLFGLNVGMAFQIIDDALDYCADETKLGKAMFADLNEGKITLPLILILQNGTKGEKKKLSEIIKSEKHTADDIKEVYTLIKKYDSVNYVKNIASDFVKKGVKELKLFPESEAKEALLTIADFVINRGY